MVVCSQTITVGTAGKRRKRKKRAVPPAPPTCHCVIVISIIYLLSWVAFTTTSPLLLLFCTVCFIFFWKEKRSRGWSFETNDTQLLCCAPAQVVLIKMKTWNKKYIRRDGNDAVCRFQCRPQPVKAFNNNEPHIGPTHKHWSVQVFSYAS